MEESSGAVVNPFLEYLFRNCRSSLQSMDKVETIVTLGSPPQLSEEGERRQPSSSRSLAAWS